MLYDRARIHVQAGAGGDGCLSFRREAHVPRGGPDGGDGGRGADVVLVCDDSLRDLQSFRRRAHYRAPRGGHGRGALRQGASGETLVVRVPPGTQVSGQDGDLAGWRYDLVRPGQRAVVVRGGAGGRGNKRFATATRQAPRFAERGVPGEQGWLAIELKLLADVGLVGLPNAGKSSLLARLTRATPKVADYPFTTLEPVLGTLELGDRQIVLADIPGLIEGASTGAGLGHDFLAHVERTRLLVHVLDASAAGEGGAADPVASHAIVEHELASYDARLARLPRVLALSKVDLLAPERVAEAIADWSERLGPEVPVIATSSATGQGLEELAARLVRELPVTEPTSEPLAVDLAGEDALADYMVFRPAAARGFDVHRTGEHSFRVTGAGIERLLARYDIDNQEAMAHVEERLRQIGVLRALEAEGFKAGDEIEIAGVVFELDPSAPA